MGEGGGGASEGGEGEGRRKQGKEVRKARGVRCMCVFGREGFKLVIFMDF